MTLRANNGATRLAEQRPGARAGLGQPTLILGEGPTARLLAHRLLSDPELRFRPVALLGEAPRNGEGPSANGHGPSGNGHGELDPPQLGRDADLEAVVDEHRVEHAVLCTPVLFGQSSLMFVRRLQALGISVYALPDAFDTVPDRIAGEGLAGLPLIRLSPSEPDGRRLRIKYALDRAVAGVLLLLLSPLLLLAAIAVSVELGWPVFFRQRRVGRRGVEFEMLKFRTLRGTPEDDGEADADWVERELRGEPHGVDDFAHSQPSRETRVGHVFRTTGIDELPQLINVLKGEMSLIGPRPERARYVRRFESVIPRYADRHRVKSGITGWAQVNGLRGKSPLAKRVELDNYYIENWSFWLDVKILILTVVAVFRGSPQQQEASPGPRSAGSAGARQATARSRRQR